MRILLKHNLLLLLLLVNTPMYVSAAIMPFLHEYHNTICQIDYNTSDKTLEIAISLPIDDLENAILNATNDTIHLSENPEQQNVEDSILNHYINQHVQFKVNNQLANWQWIGKEIVQDRVWCYLEIQKIRQIKTLWVENTLLNELFSDQINWVYLQLKGKTKSVALQAGNSSNTFSD